MPRKVKKYDDDDGRTVADMDIDGMPWNDFHFGLFGGLFGSPRYIAARLEKKKRRREHGGTVSASAEIPLPDAEKPTDRESFGIWINAVLAGLLVAVIFIGAGFLLLLFLTKVVWV